MILHGDCVEALKTLDADSIDACVTDPPYGIGFMGREWDITPPGGIVLDPFLGSGTTGMACRYEQREFVGIEREAEYIAIAERRIAAVAPLFGEERSA